MNKIECIEDYLRPLRGLPDGSCLHRSNLDELPLLTARSPLSADGDSHFRIHPVTGSRGAGRAANPHLKSVGEGSLRLVSMSAQQAGSTARGNMRRHLVDGAYLISAVSVAAVLWWATL